VIIYGSPVKDAFGNVVDYTGVEVPGELFDKSNAQLFVAYGLSIGGTVAPAGAVDGRGTFPVNNPDGKIKAAQLVRSCRALAETCIAYEIPLLSGKDSMYVDGHLPGKYGETQKVSALETLQFSAVSVIDDINKCITMDSKIPGDLVYVLGTTCNELGASEYYEHLGYTGLNVPKVSPGHFIKLYRALQNAIDKEVVASAHGIYRGGLGVHLAMIAMGGNLGIKADIGLVPSDGSDRGDIILFSESPGRFIVTV
jgi:phosphoribosylformylglycinamidine synthase